MGEDMRRVIRSVSIFAGEVEVCHCVGQQSVDEIKEEQLRIDGDSFTHYVVYCRGEVKATVRALCVSEVTFTNMIE